MPAPELQRWLDHVSAVSRQFGDEHPGKRALMAADAEALYHATKIKDGTEGRIILHEWLASDPRDLHDHPWDCASVILSGGYWEITPVGRFWRAPGDVVFRRAEEPHRIEIDPDEPKPVSLFITGPLVRSFGFHTPTGWVPATRYVRGQRTVA